MFSESFTVTGLSCGHCVGSLTEEFTAVAGVRDVAVDLPTGRVTVTSDRHLEESDVRRVVVDAGFGLAAPVGG